MPTNGSEYRFDFLGTCRCPQGDILSLEQCRDRWLLQWLWREGY